MKPSGIGGQAVIEGVMMKNGSQYAIAVRKPNNEIVVETNQLTEPASKHPILKLPIIRGVAAFVESISIGMKTLTFSASFFEEEEEESGLEKKLNKVTKGNAEKILNVATILLSVVLAVGIFVALPMFLASFLSSRIESAALLALLEGVFRVLIFISYIFLISRIKDIKRLFMYHGAEHKSINCIENGLPLTVANVRKQSREHKRCGTSFMLTVMIVSVIFFIFIRVDHALLRFVVRLLLIPAIAGVSYEFIRFAGRSNSKIVAILSRPGMWLQALTTREPDDSMIEVAIQSVEAVFDWKSFIEKGGKKSPKGKGKAADHSKASKNTRGQVAASEKQKQEAAEALAAKEAAEEEFATAVQPKAAAEKPLEVDISTLFDIKVQTDIPEVKYGSRQKKGKEPQQVQTVTKPAAEEEDDILKALDMYFEFNETKSAKGVPGEKR